MTTLAPKLDLSAINHPGFQGYQQLPKVTPRQRNDTIIAELHVMEMQYNVLKKEAAIIYENPQQSPVVQKNQISPRTDRNTPTQNIDILVAEKAKVKKIFDLFTHGSNLSLEEFEPLVENFGGTMKDNDVQELLVKLKKKGQKFIDFDSFYDWYSKKEVQKPGVQPVGVPPKSDKDKKTLFTSLRKSLSFKKKDETVDHSPSLSPSSSSSSLSPEQPQSHHIRSPSADLSTLSTISKDKDDKELRHSAGPLDPAETKDNLKEQENREKDRSGSFIGTSLKGTLKRKSTRMMELFGEKK